MGSRYHRASVYVSVTYKILCYITFRINSYHNIKHIIVSDSEMTLLPRWMINDDSDMEYESDMELDIKANIG